jgi:dipeptidyl aminopeptidase/acylaminoacyl peptidase
MMKKFVARCAALAALLIMGFVANAQKKPVDFEAMKHWPSVGPVNISNDGKFFYYSIQAGNYETFRAEKLIVRGSRTDWAVEFGGLSGYHRFTDDSKYLLVNKPNDTLTIITLGTNKMENICNVRLHACSAQFLVYLLKNSGELKIRDLHSGHERSLSAVNDFSLSNDGSYLVVFQKNNTQQSILVVNPKTGDTKEIWKGTQTSRPVFNKTSSAFAFASNSTVWLYRRGDQQVVELISEEMLMHDKELVFGGIERFTTDGQQLIVIMEEKSLPEADPEMVKLNVWNYHDTKLQSQQLKELGPKAYRAIVDVTTRQFMRLEKDGEHLGYNKYLSYSGNREDWLPMSKEVFRMGEAYWFPQRAFVRSAKDFRDIEVPGFSNFTISPGGKYLVAFDTSRNGYLSYDLSSGATAYISKGLENNTWGGYTDLLNKFTSSKPIAGWLKDDAAVLVYDRHDLWQLDLAGKKAPVNLTNGYGKKHHTRFDIAQKGIEGFDIYPTGAGLLLAAFNNETKENGFFRTGRTGQDPLMLTMGDYAFDVRNASDDGHADHGMEPLKARDAEAYIIKRSKSTEAPNYFLTTNFKALRQLTDVHPERAYNWYTTELHKWKGPEGVELHGILYKPDDFDSTKKYPVIFYYYRQLSEGLNGYIPAELSDGRLNIAWFVSNGYLVFTPDLAARTGHMAKITTESIVSAAKYLVKFSFVESKKMGVEGFSSGGDKTNYIITHTGLFAAAASVSGAANQITWIGTPDGRGNSPGQAVAQEKDQIGHTLWEKPELYIENSPIFFADKVETPVLIMNGKNDDRFNHSIEFFLALRRLGKPSWLLEYEEEGHGVQSLKSQIDWTLRLMQFFDRYLKDKPAPVWMKKGIPAKYKGLTTGLEIDENP